MVVWARELSSDVGALPVLDDVVERAERQEGEAGEQERIGTLSGSCWAWRHVTTCAATTQLPLVLAAMDIWYQNGTNVHVACYSVDTIPIIKSTSRSPPEAIAFTYLSYHTASRVALHSNSSRPLT